jgi:hypothetical protein
MREIEMKKVEVCNWATTNSKKYSVEEWEEKTYQVRKWNVNRDNKYHFPIEIKATASKGLLGFDKKINTALSYNDSL